MASSHLFTRKNSHLSNKERRNNRQYMTLKRNNSHLSNKERRSDGQSVISKEKNKQTNQLTLINNNSILISKFSTNRKTGVLKDCTNDKYTKKKIQNKNAIADSDITIGGSMKYNKGDCTAKIKTKIKTSLKYGKVSLSLNRQIDQDKTNNNELDEIKANNNELDEIKTKNVTDINLKLQNSLLFVEVNKSHKETNISHTSNVHKRMNDKSSLLCDNVRTICEQDNKENKLFEANINALHSNKNMDLFLGVQFAKKIPPEADDTLKTDKLFYAEYIYCLNQIIISAYLASSYFASMSLTTDACQAKCMYDKTQKFRMEYFYLLMLGGFQFLLGVSCHNETGFTTDISLKMRIWLVLVTIIFKAVDFAKNNRDAGLSVFDNLLRHFEFSLETHPSNSSITAAELYNTMINKQLPPTKRLELASYG